MPSDDDLNLILGAKVAMLETLVRRLFRDEFLKAKDPVGAVDSFAERFSERWEKAMSGNSTSAGIDIPNVIISEQVNGFFDLLKHEVRKVQDNRSS